MIQVIASDAARGSTEEVWERTRALFATLGDDELIDPTVGPETYTSTIENLHVYLGDGNDTFAVDSTAPLAGGTFGLVTVAYALGVGPLIQWFLPWCTVRTTGR